MFTNKELVEMGIEFTETYKKYEKSNPATREIMCLKVMFPKVLGDIGPEDVFAGRDDRFGPIGFIPEVSGHGTMTSGFMYYCNNEFLEKYLENEEDLELKQRLLVAKEFWRNENTADKVRKAYSEEMKQTLPSDNFSGEPGIGFPLYRMGGIYLDYQKLVRLGLKGMLAEIDGYILSTQDEDKKELYTAMKMGIDLIIEVCLYYARQARALQKNEIAEVLEKLTLVKPETLREAIQLMWIYVNVSGAMNYGRMDVYLGDFYKNDIVKGTISEIEAVELVAALWRMIADKKTTWNGRVVIGGLGRHNEENADSFALAAIEATRRVKEIEPQLTLRFYKGMNPLLMEKALEAIGEGRTYPMLYNDDVNVPAVANAFEVSYEEALQYVPFGCGEYVLDHRSFGTPSGVINLTKIVEAVLHNGMDGTTGKMIGIATGEFESFRTFEDLFEAYKKQITHFVEALADQEELEYKIAGENAAFLYVSMLFDNCMEKGKGIFQGGAQYLGGTLETYGNTNAADSLRAIKELIYEKKCMTPKKMLEVLDANFVGFEKERNMMLNVIKYGNDDLNADAMSIRSHDFVCNIIRNQKHRTNLHSYLAVIINNSTNTAFGRFTGASPDGRRGGQPLANANMPSAGSDKNGITSVINSQVKLDPSIHAGAVQNMKFSRELFTSGFKTVKALLNTYFDKGGTQAMITVVNRGDLENAMREPELFKHVFVRVGGFSARFVELERDVQLEIISRTLY